MKVVLISLIEDVTVPSLRYLSAYLRSKGIDTVSILLPWQFTDMTLNESNAHLYPYSESVLNKVSEICSNADLVGISAMSNHFDNAIHITGFLRKHLPHIPIIWGGIHPTIRPVECLEYADMVCIGEGEISLYELADEMSKGNSWESISIPGIYKRQDKGPFLAGTIVNNIDELPLPLYDIKNLFILYRGEVLRLDSTLLEKCLTYYRTLFSRGCPYACTYCCNNAIRRLHSGKYKVRWRSVNNMINELKEAINLMPHLKKIVLADDSFLTQPTELIENFAEQYREKIGLPFEILSIPRSVSDYKLKLLFEAGLCSIGIGIQSGSPRISKDLYRRPESIEDILLVDECIKRVVKETKKKVSVRYDFILDNPWEDEQDILDSIHLSMKLRKASYSGWRCNLILFSLKFYPGTDLYEKARSEGIICDDLNQIYRASQLVKSSKYLNEVFGLLAAGSPDWLINLSLRKQIEGLNLTVVLRIFELMLLAPKASKYFLDFMKKGEKQQLYSLLSRILSKLSSVSPIKSKRPKFCGGPGEFIL